MFDDKRKAAEKRLEDLKERRVYTQDMHRNKRYTDVEYDEEMGIIRNEMAVAQLEINENLIDRNELELLLTQAELFITRLEPLYRSFSTANKRRFITLVFPKGVVYESGKVEPVKKSLLFEYLGDLQDQKLTIDEMVTLPGIEPGLPN